MICYKCTNVSCPFKILKPFATSSVIHSDISADTSHTLRVKNQIEEIARAAELGGGQKRINAQHAKVKLNTVTYEKGLFFTRVILGQADCQRTSSSAL